MAERRIPTSLELDRFMANAEKRAVSQPFQLHGWVHGAARASLEVARGNTDLIDTYWIGLYGILHDLRQHLERKRTDILEYFAQRRQEVSSSLATIGKLLTAIEQIRALFSDDQAVYIQFMRHVYSHPFQDNYRIHVQRDGLKMQLTHHLIGKTLTVEETDAAIMRVFKPHFDLFRGGRDTENEIAKAFATVSHSHQAELARIWPEPQLV